MGHGLSGGYHGYIGNGGRLFRWQEHSFEIVGYTERRPYSPALLLRVL